MKKLVVVTFGAVGVFVVAVVGMASADAITINPSYAQGTFSSDYTQVTNPDPAGPGGQWAETTYALDYNPNTEHDLWTSYTAPGGEMLVSVNGATTPGLNVWLQIGSLASGTYTFETLVANSYYANPPTLELEVDGTQVGSSISLTSATGVWNLWSTTFTTSGGDLSIVDENTEASGNDFSLAHVPDGGTTAVLLGGALIGLQGLRRKMAR